jgi:peptide/nickel transport system permease protein
MNHGALLRAGWPLLLLHVFAFGAGFLAPYSATEYDRSLPFAPPTRVHFNSERDGFQWRPFVYAMRESADRFGEYAEDRTRRYPIRLFVRGEPHGPGGFESRFHLFRVDAPARIFLLGSDGVGRDQLSRLLHGTRTSLFAGWLAAGLSLGLGLALGTIAGFYGAWIDTFVMRLAELFLATPWLYLLLAVRAFLPLELDPGQALLILVLVIGLVDWARPARLVRGVTLSARERDYVWAARGLGASDAYLLVRHVVPQSAGVLLTQAALVIPQYVLAEVTLSFLGLGIGEGVASLGSLLGELQRFDVMTTYWWMWFPAFALVFVFFAYYRLADALRMRWRQPAS